jgi:hypothetical protein
VKKVVCISLEKDNLEKLKVLLKENNIPLSVFIDSLIEQFVLNKEVNKK